MKPSNYNGFTEYALSPCIRNPHNDVTEVWYYSMDKESYKPVENPNVYMVKLIFQNILRAGFFVWLHA